MVWAVAETVQPAAGSDSIAACGRGAPAPLTARRAPGLDLPLRPTATPCLFLRQAFRDDPFRHPATARNL